MKWIRNHIRTLAEILVALLIVTVYFIEKK